MDDLLLKAFVLNVELMFSESENWNNSKNPHDSSFSKTQYRDKPAIVPYDKARIRRSS